VSIEIPNCHPDSQNDQELLITLETDGDYANSGAGVHYPSDPLSAFFLHYTSVSGIPAEAPTVISIVPDHAFQHTLVSGAIIAGTNFSSIASVRLEKGAAVINATTFTVDSVTQIKADFDIDSADIGKYDVVVRNSGGLTGKLVQGFEVLLQCGTTAPSYDKAYTLDHYLNTNWVSGILTAGPYKGYSIFPECNIVTGGYRVFDHMTQANGTTVISWPSFGAYGNAFIIEGASHNGLMIVFSPYFSNYLQVVNQTTGALVQNMPDGHGFEPCGGFDGNDDFWSIALQDVSPNVYDYYLQHWTYNSGSPSSPYSLAKEWNVNSLFRDDVPGQTIETYGDLVLTPDAHYCFVLTGNAGGDDHKVDKVDLTGTSPVIVASHSFAGENLDGDSQYDDGQSRSVKMELDTSNSDYIPCRLVVAGSKYSGSSYYINIYRFDTDLNLLGKSSAPYDISTGGLHKWYGFCLDPENKVLVHLTEYIFTGSITYYGISKLPTDW
jgi:hypothetical protein